MSDQVSHGQSSTPHPPAGHRDPAELGPLIDALRRSAGRLLFVDAGDSAERDRIAAEVLACESRLAALLDLVQGLAEGGESPGAQAPRSDSTSVAAALAPVLEAIDAFVSDPTRARALTDLQARLGALETLIHGGAAPPQVSAPARAVPPAAPMGAAQGAGARHAVLGEPPPTSPGERLGDRPPTWVPTPPYPRPNPDTDLVALTRRVRRLEVAMGLAAVLALIVVLLLAGVLWRGELPLDLPLLRSSTQAPVAEPGRDLVADRCGGGDQPPCVAEDRPASSPDTDRFGEQTATAWAEPPADLPAPAVELPSPGAEGTALELAPNDPMPSPPDAPPTPDPDATDADDPASEVPAPEAHSSGSAAIRLDEAMYGVQLIAFRDLQSVLDFAQRGRFGDDLLYGESRVGAAGWYIVVKGLYTDGGAAREAVDQLPAELRRLDPWIRKFPAGTELRPLAQ